MVKIKGILKVKLIMCNTSCCFYYTPLNIRKNIYLKDKKDRNEMNAS